MEAEATWFMLFADCCEFPPCFPLERFPPACLAGLPEFLEGGSTASEVEEDEALAGCLWSLESWLPDPDPSGERCFGEEPRLALPCCLPSEAKLGALLPPPDFLPLNPLLGPPLPPFNRRVFANLWDL